MTSTTSPTRHDRSVLTPDLAPGMVVVVEGGMRCLIDGPIVDTWKGGRSTRALVLNRELVPASTIPWSFTADQDGEHRWTVQGAPHVTWAVEVASS